MIALGLSLLRCAISTDNIRKNMGVKAERIALFCDYKELKFNINRKYRFENVTNTCTMVNILLHSNCVKDEIKNV